MSNVNVVRIQSILPFQHTYQRCEKELKSDNTHDYIYGDSEVHNPLGILNFWEEMMQSESENSKPSGTASTVN